MGVLGFINIPIVEDIIAFFITLIAIFLVIEINDKLRKSGKLSINVSRKIIHIFAAPIYIAFFPFYSGSWYSPIIAMIVPLIFALKFLTIGLGIKEDEAFVNTMSRSGDPRELLRGTFYYTIVMIFFVLVWWTHPLTVIALSILAFGDGFGDVIGRNYGKRKIKVTAGTKTLEGSLIGVFLIGFVFTLLMLFLYSLMGAQVYSGGSVVYTYTFSSLLNSLVPVLILSIVATIAELYSPKDVDNIIIPAAVVIAGIIMIYAGLWPGLSTAFQFFWQI